MLSIIQEYSNHLEEIFENSFDYIYLHDKEGNILDVNNIVVKNLGYSRKEILDMKVTDFLLEEVKSEVSDDIKMTIETGLVNKPKTYKVRKKDGVCIYVEASAIPLKKNGEIYAILGIGHDVTIYKKIEQKLRESEKRFRHLFDQSPFSISLFDINGNLLESNKKFIQNLANYTDKNYIGKHFIEIALDFQNSKELIELYRKRNKALRKGAILSPEEFCLITLDGKKIWLYFLSSLVTIGSEKFIQVLIQDITERKTAEEKLKESEQKFRAISEQSFMSIMVIQDGILKYFNDRLPKRSGYSPEEIKSWSPNEFAKVIHPDDREFVMQQARKKQEGQEDVINNYKYRSIRKNGEIRWNENFSKTINYGGRPADLVMSVDITDKLEAEQGLKESEEKFRTLFEKANDGILLTDTETEQILTGNKKISEMLGYSLEELRNLNFRDLHPIESLHYINGLFEDDQQDGSSIAKDIPFKRKNGSVFYCNVNSSKIELAGKTYFMGIFRDITERKISLQKLKESEEKFRNIAEQSFMGILIIQHGELKYINEASSKISGYSIDEMLNWTQKDILKLIHPDDIDFISKRFQRNIEDTMGSFSSNVFRIINKNGDLRWLEDYTTRIDYQGKPANLISIVDITERKEVEQLIIEENKRLLELHELRKDLITRVSHELKTPMTSIYGASQILTNLYINEIGEEHKKYIEIGHRGCLRLKQLIDNLLDVSRLDAKRFELKLQREDLVEQIIDCAKDMNYLATDRQLKMKLELPNEVFLEIDRLRFRQVLTNIISNAIKNTPIGGEIFIDLVESTEFVDIRIKDTGVGLTENEKEKLFEKFGKIERYGMDLGVDIEGSGLGLYISKEIVDLHGGHIFVESEGRNKGSTFIIRLFRN